MKTKMILSALLLLGVLTTNAQKDTKPWSIGFGVEGGAPVGDARNVYGFNFGVTGRFSYHVGPGWATFTTGSAILFPKNIDNNDNNLEAGLQVPFKLGYKYIIAGPLFVMGEAGYSVYQHYYNDAYDNVQRYSTGGFTYAPSIGVTKGIFDASVKYESVVLSGGNLSHVNIRLGFNF